VSWKCIYGINLVLKTTFFLFSQNPTSLSLSFQIQGLESGQKKILEAKVNFKKLNGLKT
jgi:hypothetical protein